MAASVQANRSRSRRSPSDRLPLAFCLDHLFTSVALLTAGVTLGLGTGCRSSRVVSLKTLSAPVSHVLPKSSSEPEAVQPSEVAKSLQPEPQPEIRQATHLAAAQDLTQSPADAAGAAVVDGAGAGSGAPAAANAVGDAPAQAATLADVINQNAQGPAVPTTSVPQTSALQSQTLPMSPGPTSVEPSAPGASTGSDLSVMPANSGAGADPAAAPNAQALPQPSAAAPQSLPLPPAEAETTELALDDVLASATERFPAVREAALLRSLAIGEQIAAMGEFDDKLEAYSINQPLSFYENYRHGIGVKRPLYMGGTAYAGYRIGRGDYEPWYKERETNDGGEFKLGLGMPLLRDRAIDYRRTAVRVATLELQKASPQLFQQVLETQFEAAVAYWTWYAAARQHEIAQQLMSIAEIRVDQIEKQIAAGDVARIVGIDNSRLLTMRRAKLIEAKQKLDVSAIKLSLYHRDEFGRPIQPSIKTKPIGVPAIPERRISVSDEIARAQSNRPELQQLNLQELQLRAELQWANNQRLPDLSFGTEVSQDVGQRASSSGDKQPLILEAGLTSSMPIQRRKAIGKAQSLRAKIAQLDAKRQLTLDKIANDVNQAVTMFDAAHLRLEQAKLNKELAQQTLAAGNISFNAGDIDILLLNIYEQAFADAGVEIIHAEVDVLIAEAMLLVATGRSLLIDPEMPPLLSESSF